MSDETPNPEKNSLETYIKLLRSPTETHRISKETPTYPLYVYSAGSLDRGITVFGNEHYSSLDKAGDMETAFREAKPDLVLIENQDALKRHLEEVSMGETSEQAISRGEQYYMRWLAVNAGVEVACWDLELADVAIKLRSKHSPDAVTGFLVSSLAVRQRHGGLKMTPEEGFKSLESELGERGRMLKETFQLDFSSENLDRVSQKYCGKKVSEMSLEDADKLGAPWFDGETNKVGWDFNNERDQQAIKVIATAKDRYQKIFVTCGASHAVTWEPAIKALYQE